MLWIDGTTDDGCYHGSARKGPWAVFDDEKQDWVASELRWRWQAVLIRWWLQRRN
jgi:hypothetical protein